MQSYKINVQGLKALMKDHSTTDLHQLAEICNVNYESILHVMATGRATRPMIMKLARAFDVPGYVITCGLGTEHKYWYLCETDPPVDHDYCSKCIYWSKFMKWCTYYEQVGELLPDNNIIVHEDGRHTCTCRVLGKHYRKPTLGIITRR